MHVLGYVVEADMCLPTADLHDHAPAEGQFHRTVEAGAGPYVSPIRRLSPAQSTTPSAGPLVRRAFPREAAARRPDPAAATTASISTAEIAAQVNRPMIWELTRETATTAAVAPTAVTVVRAVMNRRVTGRLPALHSLVRLRPP
jgi:hypothetical protein